MAVIEGQNLARTREEILAELVEDMQSLVPDVYTGIDGNLMLLFQILSGSHEAMFLALQILNQDIYVHSANPAALDRHGIDRDVPRKIGLRAAGNIKISGSPGTFIPLESEAAYDPKTGDDLLYFSTTTVGSIPDTGIPTAPTLTDLAVAGNLTGTFEYVVTFVTPGGETLAGAESAPLTVAASKIHLAAIPVGGPGTTARRLYRQKNADGIYKLVATILDNSTVVYDDNIADGALGGQPPVISTAESVILPVEATEPGAKWNALANSVTEIVDMPNGVVDVTNPAPMTGGSDPEDVEKFRVRLLQAIQVPQTGSPSDLKSWSETVDGVETATVFQNDNMGTPTNGHVTVRIAGPGGAIPSADVQAAVLALLQGYDMANVTIHVGTFTPVPTDVTVSVTLDAGFSLLDVTAGVKQAIQDYINNLQVGETYRASGVIDAVFGLSGISDVSVTSPVGNLATGATSKRTPGTLSVT